MKNSKPKPTLEKIAAAYKAARAHNPELTSFVVNGIEYRRVTVSPDAPELAWDVWASSVGGDILTEKHDDAVLTRPAQTLNEGYLYVSIAKKVAIADPYWRKRVHTLVACAFLGPPTPPPYIVEHLDDNGCNCDAINLLYSTCATNRARRNGTARITPAGKVRALPLNLRLVRRVQAKTGHRGQRLTKFVEELSRQELKKPAA